MKVLNLLHYSPEFGGGLAKHLSALGQVSNLMGHKLYLGFPIKRNWHSELSKSSEIIIIPEINNALKTSFRKIIQNICTRKKIDVLHIHFEFAQPFALALSLNRWNVPTVYHWHNPPVPLNEFLSSQNKIVGQIKRYISGVAARFTDKRVIQRHISISKDISNLLVKNNWVDEKKIISVPNGVTQPQINHTAKKNIGNKVPIIGTVANFRPEKDHASLLKAVSILLRNNIRCELWIVGDGPTRMHMEGLAEDLGIKSSVRFFGLVHDTSEFYQQFDLFVLSTHYEGHSLVILEAMGYGLPIIATKVSSIPEVIEHGKTGLLVNRADHQDLAKALTDVLIDEVLRNKLIKASTESFKKQLTVNDWAYRIFSVYTSMLDFEA